MNPRSRDFTGIILSGGRGRRLGGRDKGLVRLCGRPLVAHVAECLTPQVGTLWVSINRNGDRYAALKLNAVQDRWRGYLGPLAGLASVMPRVKTPYVVVAPCDAAALPSDFVPRLWGTMHARGADVCVALCDDRLFPLHVVMKTRMYRSLHHYVSAGGAQVQQWLRGQRWTSAVFEPGRLNNINSAESLAACTTRGHRRQALS